MKYRDWLYQSLDETDALLPEYSDLASNLHIKSILKILD